MKNNKIIISITLIITALFIATSFTSVTAFSETYEATGTTVNESYQTQQTEPVTEIDCLECLFASVGIIIDNIPTILSQIPIIEIVKAGIDLILGLPENPAFQLFMQKVGDALDGLSYLVQEGLNAIGIILSIPEVQQVLQMIKNGLQEIVTEILEEIIDFILDWHPGDILYTLYLILLKHPLLVTLGTTFITWLIIDFPYLVVGIVADIIWFYRNVPLDILGGLTMQEAVCALLQNFVQSQEDDGESTMGSESMPTGSMSTSPTSTASLPTSSPAGSTPTSPTATTSLPTSISPTSTSSVTSSTPTSVR